MSEEGVGVEGGVDRKNGSRSGKRGCRISRESRRKTDDADWCV